MQAAPLRGSIGMVAGGTVLLGDVHDKFAGTYAIQITGTWTGTITFQVSLDNTTYVSQLATPSTTSTPAATTTANGVFYVDAPGISSVRVSGTAGGTGTAVIYARPCIG